MTKFFAGLSTAALIGGAVLVFAGTTVPGIVLIVAAFVLAAILGAIATALRVRNSIREWTGLLSGGGPLLAGRVPTPLGKLTESRELDLAVYRKRGT